MKIGTLNRYVSIEQLTITQDADYGSKIEAWTEYKKDWANVIDISARGQEQTNSDLRQMKRPCEVTMRYDSNINSTMRLVMLDRDNRLLQIVSKPAELGQREAIMFMCEDYDV